MAVPPLAYAMGFHFLVDAVCCATVLGPLIARNGTQAFEMVSVYNFLAFATQMLTGYLADRVRRDRWLGAVSIAMLGVGGCLTLGLPWLSIGLLGLGNSLFHVSAGREVIRTQGIGGRIVKSWALGFFVAPGALGICMGTLWPTIMHSVSLAALLAMAVLYGFFPPEECLEDTCNKDDMTFKGHGSWHAAAAAMMGFCVLCRAAAGSCMAPPWQGVIAWSLALGVGVVLGKMAGGILADRMGPWTVGLWALGISWLLLTMVSGHPWGFWAGQVVANLMMAVTLFVLVWLYPQRPGLMFGLAAALLFPGSLVRFMPHREQWFSICYLVAMVCFAATGWLCRRNGMGISLKAVSDVDDHQGDGHA